MRKQIAAIMMAVKEAGNTVRITVVTVIRIVDVPGLPEGLRVLTMMMTAEERIAAPDLTKACQTTMIEIAIVAVINMMMNGLVKEIREGQVITRKVASTAHRKDMTVIVMETIAGIPDVNRDLSIRKVIVSMTMIEAIEIRAESGAMIAGIRAIADLNTDQDGVKIPDLEKMRIMGVARTEVPGIGEAHGIMMMSAAAEEIATCRLIV